MKSICYLVISVWEAIFITLAVFLFTTCSTPTGRESLPTGKLGLRVGISVSAEDVFRHLKAAEPEEFVVTIYSESGTEALSYPRAAELPETIELPAGSYYVIAHSNNSAPAAFENEYYSGTSETFTIREGETTEVSLTCSLANIRVTVVYDASVISRFESYETTVSNSGGSLTFSSDEIRAGYFDEGPLAIVAGLLYTDEAGALRELSLTGSIPDATPGKHYEIAISVSAENGSGSIAILVDESFETEVVSITDEELPMSGELLITEIMYNPSAIGDAEGEYIEITNVSTETVNLQGLVIRRGSTNDTHVISEDLPLAPGGVLLLGRSAGAAAEVDYVYSNISLLNSGDVIYLNHYGTDGINGEVICRVDYGASGFPGSLTGQSVQLDPAVKDVNDALLGSNWCASGTTFLAGDYGTPGEANTNCL
ncbi:MAG: DUF4493 domain-containing protein [Bacteroidales bacterium]|nr:DUF4493 domain-containing protein [Bacteroidales bacterium]